MFYLVYDFCKTLKNIFSGRPFSLISTGSNAEFDKGPSDFDAPPQCLCGNVRFRVYILPKRNTSPCTHVRHTNFFLSVIYYFFLLIIKLPPAADGIVSACDEIHRHVTIITANGSRPGQVFTPAAADTGSESVK